MEQNIFELKEVLERVEEKLISARKIHTAIQFQTWLVVMILYYIIISPFNKPPWQITAIYWTLALAVFGYISMKVLRRMKNLLKGYGRDIGDSRYFGLSMTLSWIAGAVIGWMIVPSLLMQSGVEEISAIATGFLSFISISVFGMFLTFMYFAKSFEKEMIPAYAIPALSILLIGRIAMESMVYAGFSIGLGYSFTVLLYLYTTFKALR